MTGSMTTERGAHAASLLASGKVLVAGGSNPGSVLSSAELYDPASGQWTTTGSMTTPRWEFLKSTSLPDGNVLVAGGNVAADVPNVFLSTAEVYDPTSGTWKANGSMASARGSHTMTLLRLG